MDDEAGQPRTFRLVEANAMLPTLTGLLTDTRALVEQARALQRELRMIKAVGHDKYGSLIMAHDYRQTRDQFGAVVQDVNEIIDGIQRTGCQLKSIDLGLIDFPGTINGQPVLFCWRLGEPEIMHYHPWDAGYAGRRRILPDDDDTPHEQLN